MASSALIDLKCAVRRLFKAPRFTVLTLAVLVGGLTISQFTFSFLYSMVFAPLPFADSEQVVRLQVNQHGDRWLPRYEFQQVREDLSSFSEMAVWLDADVRLSRGDSGRTLNGVRTEPSLFSLSRSEPLLGRTLAMDDLRPGATPVVVLSHTLWQGSFNGDPDILGRQLRLDNVLTEVIGVMPPGYHFPVAAQLWLPLPGDQLAVPADSEAGLNGAARLRDGVSIAEAEAELGERLNQVYQQGVRDYRKPAGDLQALLQSLPMAQTGGEGPIVFTFLNLVALFIFLLACINVGNLLLARAIERRKETAIRAALGAPRKRLVLQLMWEGTLIALLGGVIALLLAGAALDGADIFMRSVFPQGIPYWYRWGMNLPTALVGLLFVVLTISLACFVPAWRSSNQDINSSLRDGTRGAQGQTAGRLSRLLVTVQVALISTLMLIGGIAGYLAQSLIHLNPGYNMHNRMVARISLPAETYPSEQAQQAYYLQLLEAMRQRQDILAADISNRLGQLPVAASSDNNSDSKDWPRIDVIAQIGDSAETGPRLVEGRYFDSRDGSNAQKVALISRSMARRYWPEQSAIGERIRIQMKERIETVFVVGVVTDMLNSSLVFGRADTLDEVYVSGLQFFTPYQRINFRSRSDQLPQAEESLYSEMRRLNPSLLPDSINSASKTAEQFQIVFSTITRITLICGGFALLLAVSGIYGLTANAVAMRTHEVGIRRALGASDRQIVALFLRQGSRQLLLGLGIGLLLFALAAFGFQNFTEGSAPDSLFWGVGVAVSLLLCLVILLAIYLPTRRAVALEPNAALRFE